MTKTNLITGFLGSGKTTAIRHLLAHKPEHERWAVLVNEFGEIGIDGALLADSGAVLKEIPGGCMCCVNGLPMQVGLNMLLQQTKPDRLLIEPTGLGHPKQILSLLTQESYAGWIDLQATLCLLDARQLSQPRYRDNENFRDQLAAADVILASKSDTYRPEDRRALEAWTAQDPLQRPCYAIAQGEVDVALLSLPRTNRTELPDARHHHGQAKTQGLAALRLPENARWRRALNEGQGFTSCGWIFDGDTRFDTVGFMEWVRLAPVERVKGVVRIPEGTLLINRQGQDLNIETRPNAPLDSRVELIHSENADWNALQSALFKIRLS
ncbi:CobW family GTP-binding protein [Serratia ureilytica]|uniref:CobW family GTP-binding protein n=1 Tax=Serratia ureilytica TaxID=300181 RepID=UPI0018D98DB4|nr:GTP-binding protein [Serratia ureilytica]MBH2657603.1 GTP-binding protein [Serratia ureilytica]MBH2699987.1 GTP-binding protein [Serratia ureilytica]MBH2732138.1 GTP-binding protein [Serratia ureilytica]MBH3074261.1 GTP-binding protein [Serratia ureilytica]